MLNIFNNVLLPFHMDWNLYDLRERLFLLEKKISFLSIRQARNVRMFDADLIQKIFS